ncbi:hypothetical protein [Corynebacterium sp.]|uniref:hypothetical protein n=1 Tax=Corynebacterium sp. TaxID=1720 RepID=UPI003736DC1E
MNSPSAIHTYVGDWPSPISWTLRTWLSPTSARTHASAASEETRPPRGSVMRRLIK